MLVSVMPPGIPVFWDAGRHGPPHHRELVARFLSCSCCSYGPRWKVRGSYEGGALGNAAPFVAQRRPGMRLLAMVFGPHAPDTQTARSPIFACDFNGLQRCPKLVTSSII